jgi:hypothetical protein
MPAIPAIPAGSSALLQLRVLRFSLLQDGDVGVGVFSGAGKILARLRKLQVERVDFLGAQIADKEE